MQLSFREKALDIVNSRSGQVEANQKERRDGGERLASFQTAISHYNCCRGAEQFKFIQKLVNLISVKRTTTKLQQEITITTN